MTLHRDDVRHDYFSTTDRRAPFFDSASGAWIVSDPSDCQTILGSRHLRPAAYAASYDALTERLGIGFPNIRFALDHIPLCLHGDDHKRARLHSSRFLARRKNQLTTDLPLLVQRHFGSLRAVGAVELMAEAIIPLAHDIISTIVEIDFGSRESFGNASILFDRSIGIGKRKRIELEVADLRRLIASRLGADATDDDVGILLAFVIVGKDPLIGMLGESLHLLLRQNVLASLADIHYPDLPPQTGVPIIERDVIDACSLAGQAFQPGDRVRCYLQSFGYGEEPGDRKGFFGTGAHACLGGPLAIATWHAVAGWLSQNPLRVARVSYTPRTTDYIFACPQTLDLELMA